MFFSGSRYQKQATYTVVLADGTVASVVKLPLPGTAPLAGFHRKLQSERLDLIANYYLNDATTFWRLCDANNSIVPDALAAHPLIGVPKQGT
jgi:hypothetical protein